MKEAVFKGEVTLSLPPDFRITDILPFHQRDESALAEEVIDQRLRKGMIWKGIPIELKLIFLDQQATLHIESSELLTENWRHHFLRCMKRMCGLTQPIELFRQQWGGSEQLQPLFQYGTSLRFALTPTVFEALSWAVVSQQISVKAAVKLRHRMIQLCSTQTHSGLYCYPDARTLSKVSTSSLQIIGFPKAKADTMQLLCDFALYTSLDELDGNNATEMDGLSKQLLAIKGIGHWTVNYGLLRGYGYLDGSLHGDIALRRALQLLWQHPDDVTDKQAEQWLMQFSPWRALVAAYLWQYTGA